MPVFMEGMLGDALVQAIWIGGLAAVFGGLLGFSARKFAVETDPRVERIAGFLPGANCAGCGFTSCGAFAEAVAAGSAAYNGCAPGGAAAAAGIAGVLGVSAEVADRKVAFVKCDGVDANVKLNYVYDGPKSCIAASELAGGGNKACAYGCLGLASCRNVCPFNAIRMVDGIAVIDGRKCTACGKCVPVCPRSLIEIVPARASVRVLCRSQDSVRVVKENCRAGCIGCMVCRKVCAHGAVSVERNVARIDPAKCVLCMECVRKCPLKAIKSM